MRIVRYEPFDVPPSDLERRLDALRFDWAKWDVHVEGRCTVTPGLLVLTAQEHRDLVAACQALADHAARARRRLAATPEVAAALGIPSQVADLAAERDRAPLISRFDAFPTREGWKVPEFNDDVPGGYSEALGLAGVFHDLVPEGHGIPGDLPDALVRALRPRGGGTLGLLYATGYSEDLQVVELLARLMEAHDVPTVRASPEHVAQRHGTVTLDGVPIEAAYRFFPAEWFPLLTAWPTWRRVAAEGLPVVNPFGAAWTQSKAFFAWAWDHATGRDRRLVEAHLPSTRLLAGPDVRSEALAHPEAYVLKPAFGRMGEGVVLGAEVSAAAWQKRVTQAWRDRAARPYVLQRRFHATPVEVAPGVVRTPCVGVYLVDGRFAGYYARLAEGPLVAYHAANVLPVVEGV